MLNLTHFSHFFMKVTLLNLLFGSPYYNIYKFVENCFTDKVLLSWPSSNYHFFGIAIVSSRNRVFFRTFLHFLSIHKMSVRHSKVIHIRGIKQQKILCISSFFSSRYQVFHREFICSKMHFFRGVITFTKW